MTAEFLKHGIDLYDAYAVYLEKAYVDEMLKNTFDIKRVWVDSWAKPIHWKAYYAFWETEGGAGEKWLEQIEEYFFEPRWYGLTQLLYKMTDSMDSQIQKNLEALSAALQNKLHSPLAFLRRSAAKECYRLAIFPLVEKQKEQFLIKLAEMEASLQEAITYELTLELEAGEEKHVLEFNGKYKKSHHSVDLENYAFTYNNREYANLHSLWADDLGDLSNHVFQGRDIYGSGVLQVFTPIPTFDSSDREWDSRVIEFLFFDGKDIHMLVMRGGYQIANLTFYERILSADAGMKSYFEKLGWSAARIEWK